jgi:hypothetical protein
MVIKEAGIGGLPLLSAQEEETPLVKSATEEIRV